MLVAAVALGLAACGGNSAGDPETFRPSTLLDAVLVGDRAAVEQFIADGADVNATEADGTSVLMRAIHGGFPDIAETLIEAGADVDAANRYGVNPLYLAARGKDAATARELLEAGAAANTALPEGETVLMTAARAGATSIVRMLIANESDPEFAPFAQWSTSTTLPTSGYGAGVPVQHATENRADPNAREGYYGQTALMWAAAAGHTDVVRLLLAAGANIDDRSRVIDAPEAAYERLDSGFEYPRVPKGRLTALHFAARDGGVAVVRELVEAGADLDAADAEGATPLLVAIANGRFDAAGALLDAGADPLAADSFGTTPLLAAAGVGWNESTGQGSEADSIRTLERLLDRGAALNGANLAGDTALHGAARRGSTAIAQFLVARGGDVGARNLKGQSPLDLALGVPAERLPPNEALAALLRAAAQPR